MIVSAVDSQCELLSMVLGSLLVKVTSHETVLLAVTRYVVLVVTWAVPDASFTHRPDDV